VPTFLLKFCAPQDPPSVSLDTEEPAEIEAAEGIAPVEEHSRAEEATVEDAPAKEEEEEEEEADAAPVEEAAPAEEAAINVGSSDPPSTTSETAPPPTEVPLPSEEVVQEENIEEDSGSAQVVAEASTEGATGSSLEIATSDNTMATMRMTIFGVSLDEAENINAENLAAVKAIRLWCEYILGRLDVDHIEGPWRQSGNMALVRTLLEASDEGHVEPPPGTHITVVTSLVAEFLKELPGAVLHSEEVDAFIEAGVDTAKLKDVLRIMKPARCAILGTLVKHWHLIAKDVGNLMTPKYIGKVPLRILALHA